MRYRRLAGLVMLMLGTIGPLQALDRQAADDGLRVVATLPERDMPQGMSTLLWDGRSANGTTVPAGQYLVRLEANTADGQGSSCLVPLRR